MVTTTKPTSSTEVTIFSHLTTQSFKSLNPKSGEGNESLYANSDMIAGSQSRDVTISQNRSEGISQTAMSDNRAESGQSNKIMAVPASSQQQQRLHHAALLQQSLKQQQTSAIPVSTKGVLMYSDVNMQHKLNHQLKALKLTTQQDDDGLLKTGLVL